MHVLNSLIPVFLIIALGKALTRTSFFTPDLGRTLNRITYWVALPAFLLNKITNATFSADAVSRISLLLILSTIGSAIVAALLARLLKYDRRSAGAFVQGTSRANNAFIGLPVILYAMDSLGSDIESIATIALAPAIVFYNIFSIVVLLAYGERGSRSAAATARLFAKQISTNPLLISCVIGLILNQLNVHFPSAIERSLSTLGGAALALALLSIGSGLSFKGLNQGLAKSLPASIIKIAIQPLIGFGLALLWHLPAIDRQMLLIYLACPTAVASYVMADIFDSDRELAGHIIVISTLLSAISLSIILAAGT